MTRKDDREAKPLTFSGKEKPVTLANPAHTIPDPSPQHAKTTEKVKQSHSKDIESKRFTEDPEGRYWLPEKPIRPKVESQSKLVVIAMPEDLFTKLAKFSVDSLKSGKPYRGIDSVTKFVEAAARRKLYLLAQKYNRGKLWNKYPGRLPSGSKHGSRDREDTGKMKTTSLRISTDTIENIAGFLYETYYIGNPIEDIISQRVFYTVACQEYLEEINSQKPQAGNNTRS